MTNKTNFIIGLLSIFLFLSCSKEEEDAHDFSGTRWISQIDLKVHSLPSKYTDKRYYRRLSFYPGHKYLLTLLDSNMVAVATTETGDYYVYTTDTGHIYIHLKGGYAAFDEMYNRIYYSGVGENFEQEP
jgi:hypothetical protein